MAAPEMAGLDPLGAEVVQPLCNAMFETHCWLGWGQQLPDAWTETVGIPWGDWGPVVAVAGYGAEGASNNNQQLSLGQVFGTDCVAEKAFQKMLG